jgi:hypothetical protein
LAGLKAAAAKVVITGFAAAHALRTVTVIAAAAGDFATLTNGLLTPLTDVPILLVDDGTTVRAARSVPDFKGHERAVFVVGPQPVGHDREEVQQSAVGQRLANRLPAVSLTKTIIHHMRMCDIVTRRGWMRVVGNHAIRAVVSGPTPVQLDLEWPKINTLQRDRLSRHTKPTAAKIVIDLVEFLL